MRKFFVFVCVICFVLMGCSKVDVENIGSQQESSQAEPESKKYDFATFTTENAMNFIREENIQMPEGFETIEGHEEQVLQIILFAYQNPDMCMGFSRREMMDFSLEISEKVHSYME